MMAMEYCFLVLVCGAFGVFGLGPVTGTMREKAYARALGHTNRQRQR